MAFCGFYIPVRRGGDLPEYYGPWQTVYKRSAQLQKNDKIKQLFENIRENPDMQYLCIDGTYVKAHRASAGAKKDPGHDDHQCIGVSRGGRSTKIHAVVDGLGYPLVLELTGGQVHDGVMLQKCLDQLQISGSIVLADKAYGSVHNREYIAKHDAEYCIPPKSNTVEL